MIDKVFLDAVEQGYKDGLAWCKKIQSIRPEELNTVAYDVDVRYKWTLETARLLGRDKAIHDYMKQTKDGK